MVRVISRETTVTLGLVLIVFGTIVAYAVKDASWKTNMMRDIGEIRNSLERQSGDRWTRNDMSVWTAKLGQQNPEIDVPEVKD